MGDIRSLEVSERDLRKALALGSLEEFGRLYLPDYFKRPPSELHHYLFSELEGIAESSGPERFAVAAPRASAKSTIVSFAFPLWLTCTRPDLFPFGVIISDTHGQAGSFLDDIMKEICHNDALRADWGVERGRIWTKHEIIVRTPAGEVKILSLGTGGKIRGRRFGAHRPRWIVLDDPENDEIARSPVQCNEIHSWMTKAVANAGDEGTKFLHVGTVMSQNSLLSRNLSNPGWRSKKFRAMINWPARMDLWVKWQGLRLNVQDPVRNETAKAFYEKNLVEMERGARVLWPEGDSLYALMEQRAVDGVAAFNSEKQNEPYDPSAQLFDMEGKAKYFRLHRNRIEMVEDCRVIFLHELRWFGFLDPAMGSPSGDYAAIVTLGLDKDGIGYVIDAWCERQPPSMQIQRIFDILQVIPYERFGVEANGFQELIANDLDKEAEARRLEGKRWQLPVKRVKTVRNKNHRIASLEPKISNGFILFHRKLSPVFMDMMRQYQPGGAGHDDGPDALEGAYELSKRGGFSFA